MASHKCPFCSRKYIIKEGVYDHMEKEHNDELHNLPAQQVYFNYKNRYALSKEFGKCVMSGKPTKFNTTTGRYERFSDDRAREAYRQYFRKNMMKKYGTDTLLNEPDQQKKMLANRKISGEYKWSDGTKTTYTGSYEGKFLEFLEVNFGWENPNDIMAPAPMPFEYIDGNGTKRFHIPDFYIGSLNLVVNVKSASNQHYRLRDIDTEKAQDQAIKKSNYHYIKVYDNSFEKFVDVVNQLEKQDIKSKKRIFVEGVLPNLADLQII